MQYSGLQESLDRAFSHAGKQKRISFAKFINADVRESSLIFDITNPQKLKRLKFYIYTPAAK